MSHLTPHIVVLTTFTDLFPSRSSTFRRGQSMRDSIERSRGDPMVACYIDSSFPALLHFAYKYADSPEKAILANANAGKNYDYYVLCVSCTYVGVHFISYNIML